MYMCITNDSMNGVIIPDNPKKYETQSASDVLVTFSVVTYIDKCIAIPL